MTRKWRLSTGGTSVTLADGEGAALVDSRLIPEAEADLGRATAFMRARGRLYAAAGPGSLTINGRTAIGGIAVVDGSTPARLRIRGSEIRVSPCTSSRELWAGGGRCSVSGEPLEAGDPVLLCQCGSVVMARFASECGNRCPRCGRRWVEAEERETD